MELGQETSTKIRITFGSKKCGPIGRIFNFSQYLLHAFLKKISNFDKAYLPQFFRYGNVIGLFRKLKMSSTSHFRSFFPSEDFILMILAPDKNNFFLRSSRRTCNALS